MVNAPTYIRVLQKITGLTADQLLTVRAILGIVDDINVSAPVTAPWTLAYTPTPQTAPELLEALLRVTDVFPRVPLARIKLPASNIQDFRLLALSDSPAYAAYPPREAAMPAKTFIASNWRGLNIIEGLWLTLLHPSILDERALDLVGSIYSIECTPTIYQWGGKRYLSAIAPDSRDEMCRPVFVRRSLRITIKSLDDPQGLSARLRGFISKDGVTALF